MSNASLSTEGVPSYDNKFKQKPESEIRLIPVQYLIPPTNPMRSDSLYEGMEELKESLAQNGLQQEIGVVEQEDGAYRIVWGMRRAYAVKELGWSEIQAKVYQEGQIDEEMAKAHENFHRTQIDPLEEGAFYDRLIRENNITITECARRCRRSVSQVSRTLSLLAGHPEVREALRLGYINSAQAVELNKSESPGWIRYALKYAQGQGITAANLARWREQSDATGEAANLDKVLEDVTNNPRVDFRVQNKCRIHQEWLPVEQVPLRAVCEDCWRKLQLTAEHFVACPWRENAPPPPDTPKPITEMSKEELLALLESVHKRVAEVMP